LVTENTTPEYCEDLTDIKALLSELTTIRGEMISEEARLHFRLLEVHSNYRASAGNLMHYMALRRRDLRPLQHRLAALGLSSLGRAEANVLATVDAVLKVLHRLVGHSLQTSSDEATAVNFEDGGRLLVEHSDALFGPAETGRGVRIMVTMPREAASDYALVHSLLEQGMNCMRINCAHDDKAIWLAIIENLRRAKEALGRSCRVFMDLSGPKLRTGPIQPGAAVIRIRPRRDVLGRVAVPARVWLTPEDSPHDSPSPADAVLPVGSKWLTQLRVGDQLKLTDARESRRTLTIVEVDDQGVWAEALKTTYVVPGTVLHLDRKVRSAENSHAVVGSLPQIENSIRLRHGDILILTKGCVAGRPATFDSDKRLLRPAVIGCTIPEILSDVRPGESIWFDDGRIGGVIEEVREAQIAVRITWVRPGGEKLRGDKGINFPESTTGLTAMTEKDEADLSFVAEHADAVELSFANTSLDVQRLQRRLAELSTQPPAIVLKIETRRGFDNLPDMLLTAMKSPCCGVMIARGDLAVECGFERLAEVQEELLWICEAAHVPVIWATQVLENLAREGMPSRAEISDAAMGDRAECVMLNKGPHIVTAVRVLDDILRRMQSHQSKKRAMLRGLRLVQPIPAVAGTGGEIPQPETER